MIALVPIGYDIREAYANPPEHPLPGYALGPGSVTMDSSLCRPWRPGPSSRVGVPFRRWSHAIAAYRAVPAHIRHGYAVYHFRIESVAVDVLRGMVEVVPPGTDDAPDSVLDPCGCDVVWFDRDYGQWGSFVANNGIPREVLNRYGELTTFGLFESPEAAARFRDSLDPPEQPRDAALVARVERTTSTS